MHYLYLALAIVFEVIATSAMNMSEGMTRPLPVVILAVGYGLSFYLLSLVLQYIPVGVVYAMWSGLGIVLIAVVGLVFFRQGLDLAAIIGILLIVAGVMTMSLFSDSVHH